MKNNKNKDLPKISLVTASYNQGQFIETTIQSVLSQDYPHLEYIVLDGNSNDNSVEIINKYQDKLTYWHSKADDGASAAIQQGKQMCTGELFNWLNSDDYLLSGTLLSLGTIAAKYPDYDIYSFIGLESWDMTSPILLNSDKFDRKISVVDILFNRCGFAQESTFLRLDFLQKNNIIIRKEFSNLFDTVLYEEMLSKGARILFIEAFGGVIRHHECAKTSIGVPDSDIKKYHRFCQEIYSESDLLWRRLISRIICNNPLFSFLFFKKIADNIIIYIYLIFKKVGVIKKNIPTYNFCELYWCSENKRVKWRIK
jgi:glycosyltransferase involved in cell wall biosynthesis